MDPSTSRLCPLAFLPRDRRVIATTRSSQGVTLQYEARRNLQTELSDHAVLKHVGMETDIPSRRRARLLFLPRFLLHATPSVLVLLNSFGASGGWLQQIAFDLGVIAHLSSHIGSADPLDFSAMRTLITDSPRAWNSIVRRSPGC